MKPSELYAFLVRCLTLGKYPENRESVANRLASEDFPLDWFVLFASNQFVLPAIYHNLKKFELLFVFPEEYREHLDEIYRMNVDRNNRILQQVDEINACLAGAGIQPVYMKGTGNLLDGVYSFPGERMIGDIDMLVLEKDYLKTAEMLLGLGYLDESKKYTDVSKMKHYPRLFRKDVPADIEIHRIPVNEKFSGKFSSEMIFRDKKEVAGKSNCFAESDEHKVVHNFIHSRLSNGGHRFNRVPLRDLYDLFLLSERVNLPETVSIIEEKEKAACYFSFTERMVKGENAGTDFKSPKTEKFLRKCMWMMDHYKIHRLLVFVMRTYDLVFIRYFLRMFKAVFQQESREHIFSRLKDPAWYKLHADSLKDFFK